MQQSVEALQRQFGLDGIVTFRSAQGGLTQIVVQNAMAEVHVYLHGAHISHFQPKGQAPVLWMSESSLFEAGKPIRGGIPVCFPWFGPHPTQANLPPHGFVRTREWTVRAVRQEADGQTRVTLGLSSNAETMALWPHPFDLQLSILAGRALDAGLEVKNTGTAPCTFGEALHSYFMVSDIKKVNIRGLAGADCVERVPQLQRRIEGDAPVVIAAETDRVYLNTPASCTLTDLGLGRRIVVGKTGSQSTVVWNPWIAKAKAMKDFGDNEWPGMLCIETANALDNVVTLKAGETHSLHAILSVQT